MVLNILEKSGLMRSQQGNAITLTVHGFDEEMKLEDISSMPHTDLAKLYTVRGHAPPEICIVNRVKESQPLQSRLCNS